MPWLKSQGRLWRSSFIYAVISKNREIARRFNLDIVTPVMIQKLVQDEAVSPNGLQRVWLMGEPLKIFESRVRIHKVN